MKSAVCVYARDDARTIQEWIAYHRAIGFDAVIVYDHGSSDGTAALAEQMAAIGDVRVVAWPHPPSPGAETDVCRDCLRVFGAEFDWIACLTGAEFLACPVDERIASLLGRRADASAIALNWAVFGSNGHVQTPPGLLIEAFDRRAPDRFGPNQHVKLIVRPTHVTGIGNPHYFEFTGPTVTGDGRPVEWMTPGILQAVDLRGWRVHHHLTGARADWERRVELGHREREGADAVFADYDRNEIRDRAAASLATPVWSLLDAVHGI